jgi:hypothetical protein
VPITHPEAQGDASISTDPEPEEHRFELVPPVLALPVGRPRGADWLRSVLIRPIEGNRGGILRRPRGWDGIDLQGCERNGTKPLVEIGGKQGIQEVPEAVIMERGTGEPWLQQGQQAALCQPLPHRVQRRSAIQKRQDQSVDPTPSRQPMRRVGRDEAIEHGRDLQTS